MNIAKKVYLPKRVADAIETARYIHKEHPSEMMKYMLNHEASYIESWLEVQKNMQKLMDVLYSGTGVEATPDFVSFESVVKNFIDGDGFSVYEEKDKLPALTLIYSHEDKCIYELIEDQEGPVTLHGVKSEIHGESIRYTKQKTTKTPFDYMNQKGAFFLRHYVYGGKTK